MDRRKDVSAKSGVGITQLLFLIIILVVTIAVVKLVLNSETDFIKEETSKVLKTQQNELASLKRELKESVAAQSELQGKLKNLDQARALSVTHIVDVNNEITKLREKVETSGALQSFKNNLESHLKDLSDDVAKMNETVVLLRSKLKGNDEDDDVLEKDLEDMIERVQQLEYFIGKHLQHLMTTKDGGEQHGEQASAALKLKLENGVLKGFTQCDISCSSHGMGVDIAGITNGCECYCVGGYSGEFCSKVPKGGIPLSQTESYFDFNPPPKLVIPKEREEVPPINESAPGCKDAALAYYKEKYKSEEFRTDQALKFFWELAKNSINPMCSTDSQQVVIIDIGANVGEQFKHWEREFIGLSHCKKNDSLLVLVEPNPQNLVVLDKVVKDHREKREELVKAAFAKAVAADDGAGMDKVYTQTAGSAVVVDSAMSYYDGWTKFVVNKKQVMGKHRGNERGSLNLKTQDKSSKRSSQLVITKVQRVGTMIRSLQGKGLIRANFTIPLLKIDAEGFDPAVIYGSSDILQHTNLVVYECHKLWKMAGFKFHDVVEFFAKNGFKSYKMGMFYWIPVTPPAYWDDSYEDTMVWSNCIAVKEGHPFSHMFSSPPPCK